MLENPPEEFYIAMQTFLSDSIREIHQTQDPARYLRWAKENYLKYFEAFIEDANPMPMAAFGLGVARNIWNATPLKSNRYRPDPLPKIGRNDRCYCGSGKKFKQCCQHIENEILPMDSMEVWPQLLHTLSPDELTEALEYQVIPTSVLIDIASDAFDDNEYAFTCDTLNMIFKYQPEMLKEYGAVAVQMMCDALEELEDETRKLSFLETQRHSEYKLIRGTAWQRTAATFLLMEDFQSAWAAYHTARKTTPDEPVLDTLELYMLTEEGKFDLAVRRAEMIQQQWRRRNLDQDMPEQFAFIQQVIRSPEDVLVLNEAEDDAEYEILQRLRIWIEASSTTALAAYQTIEMLSEAVEGDPLQRDKCYMLETPANLRALEAQWLNVYSGEAPLLTQTFIEPQSGLLDAQQWLDFLDHHPQAFNSLAILDDLITLLQSFDQLFSDEVYQHILSPIFERVERIFPPLHKDKRFDWGFMENRPLLRLMLNHINMLWYRDESRKSTKLMERQLLLNPRDNQGIRSILINAYLKQDANQKALELAQLYPDDMMVEIVLGQVLALYRLDQHQKAGEQWNAAQKDFNHAKRYLTQSKVARPESTDSIGLTWGGKEEMWLYREDMRDTWLRTRGIISWLK